MMPGMYVVVDGEAWEVARLLNTSVLGSGGMPVPATIYHLRHGHPTKHVTATNDMDKARRLGAPQWPHPELLPPCIECGARKGWPCADRCSFGHRERAKHVAGITVTVTDGFGKPVPR